MGNMLRREPFVNVPNGWAVSLHTNGWFWACPNCKHTNIIYTYSRTVICEKCSTGFIALLDYKDEE